ncbi:hypothetical protein Vadar_027744 [Vaccinium darrowii]|uniref:Uncharacterized protein n=1 Tax=Vaccinium darrowii TaxID=229202 RepID=A0ACB7XUX4_9ERIC|nr:hypothetical protein Vadar_027744 [Vaccinium darrowii]
MAHFPLNFFLLVSLLLSSSCVMAMFDLVDKVCIENRSPPLCRAVLRSDARSATSDLTGLGYIALDLTRKHVTAVRDYIKTLIAQNQDPGLKEPLEFCLQKYNESLDACARAEPSLGDRYYGGYYLAGRDLSSYGFLCQSEFGAKPSTLGGRNKKTAAFGDLFRSIASLLSKG